MKKQSIQDRRLRLGQGRCPVHGLDMPQIDGWCETEQDGQFTYVGCPRKDCNVEAMAKSFDGPYKLVPELQYLLQKTH